MDTLPYVVLRETAQYLSAQDLAAWSATSRNLREMLNDNQLWRPRCDPLLAEYLRNTECQVEPFFQSPEIEGSGLSPICEWRLCFMRQVHLWNNWRNDRHFEQDMSEKMSSTSHLTFHKNDFLLGLNNKEIELWNVKQSPVLLCRKSLLNRKRSLDFFKVYEDKLVATQHDLVQVFQISISTGEIIFLHCFYCDGKKKKPAQIFNHETGLIDISELEKEDNFFWIYESISTTLIRGIFFAWSENSPHILNAWNVETGVKVKEIDIGQTKITRICHRSDSDESYLKFIAEDEEGQLSAVVYCLKDFVPIFKSQICTDFPLDMLVIQDYVVIALTDRFVEIYELKTAQRILKVNMENYLGRFRFYCVGSSVFFSTKRGTLMKFPGCDANIETIFIKHGLALENTSRAMFFLSERYIITNTNWGIFHLYEVKENRVTEQHILTVEPRRSAYVRGQTATKFSVQYINQSATKFIIGIPHENGSSYKGSRIVTVW